MNEEHYVLRDFESPANLRDFCDAVEGTHTLIQSYNLQHNPLDKVMFTVGLQPGLRSAESPEEAFERFAKLHTGNLIKAANLILRDQNRVRNLKNADKENLGAIVNFLVSDWVSEWLFKKPEEEKARFKGNIDRLRDLYEGRAHASTVESSFPVISSAHARREWEDGRDERREANSVKTASPAPSTPPETHEAEHSSHTLRVVKPDDEVKRRRLTPREIKDRVQTTRLRLIRDDGDDTPDTPPLSR